MSAPFDATLPGPLHRQADVLRARLALSFEPRFFAHDMVPARLTPSVWSDLTRRKPFVGLGWTGMRPSRDSGRHLQVDVLWDVFLVCSHLRPAERILGDRLGPGILGMATVATLSLHGLTIGGEEPATASGTVQVIGCDHSYFEGEADSQTAIARIGLAVPLLLRHPLPMDEFLRARITWDFPVESAAIDNHDVRSP